MGQVSSKIVGTNIIPATLRNFNPLLLNIFKHGITLLDDGTFTTVKGELQRMADAKLIDHREGILLEHVKNMLRDSVGAKFAVGYFFTSGLAPVMNEVQNLKEFKILIGNISNIRAMP